MLVKTRKPKTRGGFDNLRIDICYYYEEASSFVAATLHKPDCMSKTIYMLGFITTSIRLLYTTSSPKHSGLFPRISFRAKIPPRRFHHGKSAINLVRMQLFFQLLSSMWHLLVWIHCVAKSSTRDRVVDTWRRSRIQLLWCERPPKKSWTMLRASTTKTRRVVRVVSSTCSTVKKTSLPRLRLLNCSSAPAAAHRPLLNCPSSSSQLLPTHTVFTRMAFFAPLDIFILMRQPRLFSIFGTAWFQCTLG